MLRRLRIYFTGFGIGLIMVYFFFGRDGSRDLDIWTPSQRILEDIRNDSTFRASERLSCFSQCLSLSDDDLLELWTDAEVESRNPGGDPYRYGISLTTDSLELEAEIELKGEVRKLNYLKRTNQSIACNCEN